MSYLVNSCETGYTSGTAVTAGNSDDGSAGNAFATSKGLTSAIDYSSAWAADGTLSHLFTCASGESVFLQWFTSQGFVASAQAAFRFYLNMVNLTTNLSIIFQARGATAGMGDIGVLADGKLRVRDLSEVSMDALWVGGVPPTLSIATEYRIEGIVHKGTTASNGRIQVTVYAGDSATALATLDTGATVNTGTTDCYGARFGRGSASTGAHSYRMDAYAMRDGTTLIGPLGANQPPTITVAASQTVARSALTTISWTANDPDGTVASTAIVQSSGPAATLAGTGLSRTFTPTVAGIYVFSITATDNAALQGPASVHTVYVTDVSVRPIAVTSNAGGFTNVGGAASIEAGLADESDATYAASPDNPLAAVLEVEMPPLGPGNVTVKTRNRANAASPAISRLIQLRQGSTVIASATINPLPTVATDHEFVTTPLEASAITDRTALRVRIVDAQA